MASQLHHAVIGICEFLQHQLDSELGQTREGHSAIDKRIVTHFGVHLYAESAKSEENGSNEAILARHPSEYDALVKELKLCLAEALAIVLSEVHELNANTQEHDLYKNLEYVKSLYHATDSRICDEVENIGDGHFQILYNSADAESDDQKSDDTSASILQLLPILLEALQSNDHRNVIYLSTKLELIPVYKFLYNQAACQELCKLLIAKGLMHDTCYHLLRKILEHIEDDKLFVELFFSLVDFIGMALQDRAILLTKEQLIVDSSFKNPLDLGARKILNTIDLLAWMLDALPDIWIHSSNETLSKIYVCLFSICFGPETIAAEVDHVNMFQLLLYRHALRSDRVDFWLQKWILKAPIPQQLFCGFIESKCWEVMLLELQKIPNLTSDCLAASKQDVLDSRATIEMLSILSACAAYYPALDTTSLHRSRTPNFEYNSSETLRFNTNANENDRIFHVTHALRQNCEEASESIAEAQHTFVEALIRAAFTFVLTDKHAEFGDCKKLLQQCLPLHQHLDLQRINATSSVCSWLHGMLSDRQLHEHDVKEAVKTNSSYASDKIQVLVIQHVFKVLYTTQSKNLADVATCTISSTLQLLAFQSFQLAWANFNFEVEDSRMAGSTLLQPLREWRASHIVRNADLLIQHGVLCRLISTFHACYGVSSTTKIFALEISAILIRFCCASTQIARYVVSHCETVSLNAPSAGDLFRKLITANMYGDQQNKYELASYLQNDYVMPLMSTLAMRSLKEESGRMDQRCSHSSDFISQMRIFHDIDAILTSMRENVQAGLIMHVEWVECPAEVYTERNAVQAYHCLFSSSKLMISTMNSSCQAAVRDFIFQCIQSHYIDQDCHRSNFIEQDICTVRLYLLLALTHSLESRLEVSSLLGANGLDRHILERSSRIQEAGAQSCSTVADRFCTRLYNGGSLSRSQLHPSKRTIACPGGLFASELINDDVKLHVDDYEPLFAPILDCTDKLISCIHSEKRARSKMDAANAQLRPLLCDFIAQFDRLGHVSDRRKASIIAKILHAFASESVCLESPIEMQPAFDMTGDQVLHSTAYYARQSYSKQCLHFGLPDSMDLWDIISAKYGEACHNAFIFTIAMIFSCSSAPTDSVLRFLSSLTSKPETVFIWPDVLDRLASVGTGRTSYRADMAIAEAVEYVLQHEAPRILDQIAASNCSVLALVAHWRERIFQDLLDWHCTLVHTIMLIYGGAGYQVYLYTSLLIQLEPKIAKISGQQTYDTSCGPTGAAIYFASNCISPFAYLELLLQEPIPLFQLTKFQSAFYTYSQKYNDRVIGILHKH